MLDAGTLAVVDEGESWGNEGHIERASGHILEVGSLSANGFLTAFALGTMDEVATGGWVRDSNVNNGVTDAIVVPHPALGEVLALAAEDRIVFQSFMPQLGEFGIDIDAGVARTTTMFATWIDAIDSITIAGLEVPFRGLDYDFNGEIDNLEVDLPSLPTGRHLVHLDCTRTVVEQLPRTAASRDGLLATGSGSGSGAGLVVGSTR